MSTPLPGVIATTKQLLLDPGHRLLWIPLICCWQPGFVRLLEETAATLCGVGSQFCGSGLVATAVGPLTSSGISYRHFDFDSQVTADRGGLPVTDSDWPNDSFCNNSFDSHSRAQTTTKKRGVGSLNLTGRGSDINTIAVNLGGVGAQTDRPNTGAIDFALDTGVGLKFWGGFTTEILPRGVGFLHQTGRDLFCVGLEETAATLCGVGSQFCGSGLVATAVGTLIYSDISHRHFDFDSQVTADRGGLPVTDSDWPTDSFCNNFFDSHCLTQTTTQKLGVGSLNLTGRGSDINPFGVNLRGVGAQTDRPITGAIDFVLDTGFGLRFWGGFTTDILQRGVGSLHLTGRDHFYVGFAVLANLLNLLAIFQYLQNKRGGLPWLSHWPHFCTRIINFSVISIFTWTTSVRQWFFWATRFFSLLLAKLALEGNFVLWHWRNIAFYWHSSRHGFWTPHLSALTTIPFSRSGPKSRHCFATAIKRRGFSLLLVLLTITMMQNNWGEGCGPTMGATEVPPHAMNWFENGTKQHGQQPTMCSGTTRRLEAAHGKTKVEKRSIQRAYSRSLRLGFAWYKGKQYGPADFERMGCRKPVTALTNAPISHGLQHDWMLCNKHHPSKRRLNIWQWNCGGLSAPRLDEVKAWLTLNCIDLAILVETRMGFDAEWSDEKWHILHSGEGPNRGKGIMLLISKHLCAGHHIYWQNHISGRLVHLRLHLPTRPLDILACYQHTFQSTDGCRQAREHWWTQLDKVLQGIPNRNGLVLLGDFNCALPQSQGITGTSSFTWKNRAVTGKLHADHPRFLNILRNHALVVLNSWSRTLGPTYVHGDQASRLDFICVRQMWADQQAKSVQYLWHSPFLNQTEHGHVPILCNIARHWIPEHRRSCIQQVTLQQRQASRLAYLAQSPEWTEYTLHSQSCLANHLQMPIADVDQTFDHMHREMLDSFCRSFPAGHKARAEPAWQVALPTILSKWAHRRFFLQPRVTTTRSILHVWFHVTKFAKLKRLHQKQARRIRRMQFAEVVETAAQAAAHHDTHKLFQVINRYAPKQPRKQIQIRNHEGHMATPHESAAIINKFVADTWHGPDQLHLHFDGPPGVPFSVSQLERALMLIPGTKATARPFAPGVVWRQHASFLAPILHARLTEWWSQQPPIIPSCWRHGWLFLIPKPLKPPVSPANLRPLALQEPVGKAVIGLLIHLAMLEAKTHLIRYPIWAYLEHRSTLQAIRRVILHCETVRNQVKMFRSTPHNRTLQRPCNGFYGGAQIFLDLQRAFDCVDRVKLFSKMHLLGISSSIIQILAHWHENMAYIVQHDTAESSIPVGRGVRQGCKAAPGLWCSFLVIFFHELQEHEQVTLDWIQNHITIYADDCHIGACFNCLDDFFLFHQIVGLVFQTLHHMDMQINPGKSVAILNCAVYRAEL